MPTELLPAAVLLSIAPGYVLIFFATHGRTGRLLTPDLHLILQSLATSAVLLAVLGPIVYGPATAMWRGTPPNIAGISILALLAFVLLPAGIGRLIRHGSEWLVRHPKTRRAACVRGVLPSPLPPTIWDWAVLSGRFDDRYVIIEYADGHRIAGSYGAPGALTTSPEKHGVYLAKVHELAEDGVTILEPLTGSAGSIVPIRDDVRAVHMMSREARKMEREPRVEFVEEQRGLQEAVKPPPPRSLGAAAVRAGAERGEKGISKATTPPPPEG